MQDIFTLFLSYIFVTTATANTKRPRFYCSKYGIFTGIVGHLTYCKIFMHKNTQWKHAKRFSYFICHPTPTSQSIQTNQEVNANCMCQVYVY